MSYLSFHLQTNVQGWLDAVARAQPRVLKVFQIEMANAAKTVSPDTKIVFRHYVEHQQPYLDKAVQGHTQALEAAADYINQFEDSLNRQGGIDYVESLNETIPSFDIFAQMKSVAFDIGFCEALAQICPDVKPAVFTAPIGNPDHHEFGVLLPLAEVCEAFGGCFSYHAYHPVVDGESFVHSFDHQRNLHLRWVEIDEFLLDSGYRVDWFLGEIGPIGANDDGYGLRANDGWKHSGVWNGDRFACVNDLAAFDRVLANTMAAREGRLIGATIFTSGPDWKHFQIRQPILDEIADYIQANPTPPEPDPEPESRIVDIVDTLLKGSGYYAVRHREAIDLTVVHHTATRASLEPWEAATYHVNTLEWPGIAYHYFIVPDGTIYQTNKLETVSYHAGNANTKSIGVALAGNFYSGDGVGRPSLAQQRSLRWLHNVHLPAVLGRSIPLLGHKEVPGAQTACPGDNWDWHKLDESGGVEPDPDPEPFEVVELRVATARLNVRTGPGTAYAIVGQLWQGAELWAEHIVTNTSNGDKWACFAELWAAVRYNGVTLMEEVE